jgi:BASS family bile acid:Na+ symporter
VALAVLAGLVAPLPWQAVAPYRAPLLAYNVFAVSIGIGWEDLRRLVRFPRYMAAVYGLMFLVAPGVGALMGRWAFPADPALAEGLLLLASMPAGAMAAVWTGLLGGNAGLSLTVVGVTTLTCGLVTPAVLRLFGGRALAVNAGGLARNLAVNVMVPAVAGVVLGNLWPRFFRGARPWTGLALQASVVAIVGATAWEERSVLLSPQYRSVVALLVGICAAYLNLLLLLSYLGAAALTDRIDERTSLVLTISMRNNNAAIILAAAYLSARAALPGIVMLLVQQPLVWLVVRRLHRHSAAVPARTPTGLGL